MKEIKIVPTPKQREAARIANENLITLYGGAIRGGKSYWLILLIFTYAMQHDKSRWAIIRASYAVLKSTLIVTFNKLLSEGLSYYVTTYNKSDFAVILSNGSEIIFFAESFDTDKDHNRFKGLEVNGFGIDEINEIDESTFNKCIERAGSWQGSPGCPIKILATCNPSNNWVKEKFYDRYDNNTLPYNWAYVPSKITDNPHISQEYIESLKSMPEHEYEVFVNGNWSMKLEGLLFFAGDLQFYKPNADLDKQFQSSMAYADIADAGEDSTSVPVGRNIKELIYITDWIHNDSISDITIPMVKSMLDKEKCMYIRVESNNMGAMYGRNLQKELKTCTVYPAVSTSNKHTRILMEAAFILKHCRFLAPEFQSEEYKKAMKELTSYLKNGKSKHDDAPDALSGLAMFVRGVLPHLY